jgi:hypothetical protein
MTREERKAERRAQEARIAAWVWAQYAAKNTIKAQIRARGERVSDFSHKEIVLWAEAWLEAHPEMWAEARARAAVEFAP